MVINDHERSGITKKLIQFSTFIIDSIMSLRKNLRSGPCITSEFDG